MKAFFGKIWAWIKSTATKVWKWSIAHKAIAITMAAVVVAGTTCAIVLPIALHDHSYAAEWSSDATNHWHEATCKHEEEISDLAAHVYANDCDDTCDTCGYTRTVGVHVYDNACDTTCNVCNAERTVEPHVYDNACDTACNVCNAERTVEPHVYDNACDIDCNECGATRTITHDHADTLTAGETTHWYACSVCGDKKGETAHVYDNACDTDCNECGATRTITHDHADTLTAGETTHWYACSVCGDKKDEVNHTFDQTVVHGDYLKAAATATTKAQYYKSCVCGAKSTTEYFETDKLPANLQVSDISKTYDGTSVAEPTVTFDGVGAESFAYYKGDEKLTERPTNAGTYKVVVMVDETDTHAGDRVEREFTIAKKTLNYLELTKVYDGEGVLAYALGTEHGVVAGDTVLFYCDEAPDYIVGTYKLIPYDDPTTIDEPGADDRALLAGADAANYTFAERIEGKYKLCATITVTPKPLNLLNIEFTYDGGSIPVRFDLTAADGVIAGDDVYLYCDGNQDYYESYDEHTLYALDDSDDGYADAEYVEIEGDDAANYTFTYDPEGSVGKVTVMPYVLEFTGEYVKEYDGTHYVTFTQDITFSNNYVETVTVKLPLLDLDGQYITNAGVYTQENAQFGPPEFYVNSSENLGYDLDDSFYAMESEFEVTFTPKALTGSLILDVYYGDVKKLADSELYYYDQVITETEYGVLTGDSVTVRVLYANPNAGTADTSFAIYGESNYAIGDISVNNSTISQKKVTELPATLEAEYSGTNSFVMNLEIDGMDATLTFDTEDTLTIGTFNRTIHNPSLGDNYLLDLSETTYEIKIAQKKITKLDLRVTYDTYNNMYITLLTKDGIVAGEKVKLMVGHNHTTTLPVGTVLKLQQSTGALHGEDYEVIVSMLGENMANYDLVAYDDGNGNKIYGTMTIVASCEIQDDGNCACGGHITELTLNSPQVVSDQGVTEGEATYFSFKGNSGIYRISDYVVGTASPWATITVSLENGTAVEPVREDEYFFKDDTVYRIKAVATNTLDYDTVMIKVVEVPATMMENSDPSNVTSKLITVNLTASSTGGWYKVYVESGSYYLSSPTAVFKGGDLVYNSKGERVKTFTGTNYWLEEGTYYFYIPLKGDMVTNTSVFYLNRNGMELDCQSAYVLSKFVKVTEKMYIKVNGAGGSMNEFTVAGDMDDEVAFNYDIYRDLASIKAGDAMYSESSAKTIFCDVCDTSDCVYVITITVEGSIVINVS